MTKYPVIQAEHYVVYVELVPSVEPVQTYWFIHMDVFKWSKTIRQQFLSDWNAWTEQHKDKVLLAMPFIDDTKMEKWTAMTGFKLIEHHKCTDGVVRKLYSWGCKAAGSK